MRKFYISFLFLLIVSVTASQLPVLNWAKTFETNNIFNPTVNNNGRTVGIDAQGNVYSAGVFQYSVDFDPGPGVYSMAGGSPSNFGIYITKLNANGNFVWAKQIPTLSEWGQIELKLDRDGNIYVTSDLRDNADMDSGPGVFMMSITGFRDVFIIKLDPDGNLLWAKQFGGPGDTGPSALAIEIDMDNNVIIGGVFNNTVDFDPGPGLYNLTSTNHFQGFVSKLNSNGDLLWVKQFGNSLAGTGGCQISDIRCDSRNNIVIIGSFSGTCDFDPGPGVSNVTSSPGTAGDGFFCKLDANSNLIWVKSIGQTGSNNHFVTQTGLEIDGLDNLLISGFFIGTFDFDPGPGVYSATSFPYNFYILKLDGQGNFIWARIIGADEIDTGNDVVVDLANNVYIIGSFGTSVDFDPGPGVHIINSPHYGPSGLVKLTPDGNFVYAAPFPSLFFGTSLFRRMVIDPVRNIYITGSVSGLNDFDPGPGEFPVNGSSNSAPFVMKLSPCLNVTSSTLNINSCDSYTLNNQTYSASGTYQQTVPNSTGCDSIITLHLTVNKKFTDQTRVICEGDTFFAGGSNQTTAGTYIDTLQTILGCDSVVTTHLNVNPKPAPELGNDRNLCRNSQYVLTPGNFDTYLWQDNSTTANFTVNAAGLYWVKVTNSFNCSATDTFRVTAILESPADFLKETDSICNYSTLEIIPTNSYSSYQWSTGSTGNKIIIQSPGSYHLRVTDASGCEGKDSITVFAKQCLLGLYIPSAFTPNKDGKNDLFIPQVFGNLKQFKLTVYNRWGTVVFQTNDPQRGWDGMVNGFLQDNAVFVWVCSYQLEGLAPKTEKGTVTLIR